MCEKVVFLFGAGAEVPYGLPNGGEFALEIFRLIGEEDTDKSFLSDIPLRPHHSFQWTFSCMQKNFPLSLLTATELR